jgi:hypothetical protein
MDVFVLTAILVTFPAASSAQGSLLTLPSSEVHVTVGETAKISCSYPIISGHSYPLIKINNDRYISVSDIRRMPELGYTASAVPNSDGSQCTFTLSYNGVRGSDNGTSYRFLVFIGGPLETESAPVVLFVHEPETPPSSQLSTTSIIVIGAVCGGVCMIILVLVVMIPAFLFINRRTTGIYSLKNGLSVEASTSKAV